MRADLHMHSEHSWDSKVPIKKYIEKAEEKGIDIIAITDHNDTKSHEEIRVLQNSTDIILVPGQEINTKNGHLLIYGWIPTVPRDLTMKETIEKARKLGKEHNAKVICIAAHPFDPLRSGGGKIVLKSGIDGLETLNASSLFGIFNWKARRNSKNSAMIKLGNSDCHRSDEFAFAYNEIPESQSVDEVLDNLKFAKASGTRIGMIRKMDRFFRRKLGRMTD